MKIPFNIPYLTGNETGEIAKAVANRHISGNGQFTKLCQTFFEEKYALKKCLLTTSCTDALEMCALLLDIKAGDEVIMPSFTFTSTANAFMLRGAKIVFCDSLPEHPNIDHNGIEKLITPKTKAIVVVHYAGVSCQMDTIMSIAKKHNLFVVEDAAQSIDSYYKGKPLGGIGHLSAFSFHETKNISAGEGGMLVINDESFAARAEVIWEKGTNRSAFFRGEVDKYNWIDIGSSFLPSDLTAAFLYAQLNGLKDIQDKRKAIYDSYYNILSEIKDPKFDLPIIPDYATNNAHMFYLVCKNELVRINLIEFLKKQGIHAVFHYLPLHRSPLIMRLNHDRADTLINAENFSKTVVRLPFFYSLQNTDIKYITDHIRTFNVSN